MEIKHNVLWLNFELSLDHNAWIIATICVKIIDNIYTIVLESNFLFIIYP